MASAGKRIKTAPFRGVASRPPHEREPVRVGGLRAGTSVGTNTSRGARQCDTCMGRIKEGNWLHDRGCPHAVVQYKRYDPSTAWHCVHGCRAVEMADVRTHRWDCPFWAAHGLATPF